MLCITIKIGTIVRASPKVPTILKDRTTVRLHFSGRAAIYSVIAIPGKREPSVELADARSGFPLSRE
jgi:hypothetical protein